MMRINDENDDDEDDDGHSVIKWLVFVRLRDNI